ncbi:MAG: hypothetical protein QM576_21350 [Rhodopseudomonas sp.]|uniref:hypothetical protein n=1 Tax=Rhodopseudomonas sp. TaxID=1078 RepID=UPI0039E5AD7A
MSMPLIRAWLHQRSIQLDVEIAEDEVMQFKVDIYWSAEPRSRFLFRVMRYDFFRMLVREEKEGDRYVDHEALIVDTTFDGMTVEAEEIESALCKFESRFRSQFTLDG